MTDIVFRILRDWAIFSFQKTSIEAGKMSHEHPDYTYGDLLQRVQPVMRQDSPQDLPPADGDTDRNVDDDEHEISDDDSQASNDSTELDDYSQLAEFWENPENPFFVPLRMELQPSDDDAGLPPSHADVDASVADSESEADEDEIIYTTSSETSEPDDFFAHSRVWSHPASLTHVPLRLDNGLSLLVDADGVPRHGGDDIEDNETSDDHDDNERNETSNDHDDVSQTLQEATHQHRNDEVKTDGACDIGAADDSENDNLTCAVCLGKYRHPKILPCSHTFCRICLFRVAGSSPSFRCPLCRTLVVLPPGGIPDLQTHIAIEKRLGTAMCDFCNRGREATHVCIEDQLNLCLRCHTIHYRLGGCRSHIVVRLTPVARAPLCSICMTLSKKREAVQRCMRCRQNYCFVCRTVHNKHPGFREHAFVWLTGRGAVEV